MDEKKQLRQEFKQTKNGKKSFIIYIVFLIVFFITIGAYYILMNIVDEDYYDTVRWTATIIFALTTYFEGCYAGSLKQYIIDHKKNN